MAIKQVKRTDSLMTKDRPLITLNPDRIYYNTTFCRMIGIKAGQYVQYFLDSEERKMYFKFHKEHKPEFSFQLGGTGTGKQTLRSSIQQLLQDPDNLWIKAITTLESDKDRRFNPMEEFTEYGKMWAVQLCPAFEIKRDRHSGAIPGSARGVYRYLRNKEVVYIGRGEVLKRRNEVMRESWDFDEIEYSIVEDADAQIKWEDWWLEKHKNEHNGKLPVYNLVSGCSSFRD